MKISNLDLNYDYPSGDDQRMGLKRDPDHETNDSPLFKVMIVRNAIKIIH